MAAPSENLRVRIFVNIKNSKQSIRIKSWYPVDPSCGELSTIAQLKCDIFKRHFLDDDDFGGHPVLSIDGYSLRNYESVRILRDNDLITYVWHMCLFRLIPPVVFITF